MRQNEKTDGSQSLQCVLSQLAGAGKSHSAFSASLLTAFTTVRIADKGRRSIPTAQGVCLTWVTFTYPKWAQGLPCFGTERCEQQQPGLSLLGAAGQQREDVTCGYKPAHPLTSSVMGHHTEKAEVGWLCWVLFSFFFFSPMNYDPPYSFFLFAFGNLALLCRWCWGESTTRLCQQILGVHGVLFICKDLRLDDQMFSLRLCYCMDL